MEEPITSFDVNGFKFYLRVEREGLHVLQLTATDGAAVWRGSVDCSTAKPRTVRMSVEDYTLALWRALRKLDTGGLDPLQTHYEVRVEDGKLSMDMKREVSQGTLLLLGHVELPALPADEWPAGIRDIIGRLVEANAEQQEEFCKEKDRSRDLVGVLKDLESQLEKATQARTELEEELLGQFIVVLNEKKAELSRQQMEMQQMQDKLDHAKELLRRLKSDGAAGVDVAGSLASFDLEDHSGGPSDRYIQEPDTDQGSDDDDDDDDRAGAGAGRGHGGRMDAAGTDKATPASGLQPSLPLSSLMTQQQTYEGGDVPLMLPGRGAGVGAGAGAGAGPGGGGSGAGAEGAARRRAAAPAPAPTPAPAPSAPAARAGGGGARGRAVPSFGSGQGSSSAGAGGTLSGYGGGASADTGGFTQGSGGERGTVETPTVTFKDGGASQGFGRSSTRKRGGMPDLDPEDSMELTSEGTAAAVLPLFTRARAGPKTARVEGKSQETIVNSQRSAAGPKDLE